MITVIEEVCSTPGCVRLHYKDLWRAKQTIKDVKTIAALKRLADPECVRCQGTGLKKIIEKS